MSDDDVRQLLADGTVERWTRVITRRCGAGPDRVGSLVRLMIVLAPSCPTEEHLRQLFAQIADAADNLPQRSESLTARMREYVRAGAHPGLAHEEPLAA